VGLLIDGVWHDRWYDTIDSGGRFIRHESQFRNWVTPSGSPGPSGTGGFKAEPSRYHLYVSLACPWAHRAIIFRRLKGLEAMIGLSVVHWRMLENGWTFEVGPGVINDPIHSARFLYEVYQAAQPNYSGRVTVPFLYDTATGAIVNNESSDIIRMLNTAFDEIGAKPGDFYPYALRPEIDALNQRVYDHVNNGVYRAGFATTQAAYEEAVAPLFETLDWLDRRLSSRRFLFGGGALEPDWRLFTTLIRFDAVYFGHFKCNLRRIVDYRHLWPYARDLYQHAGIAETVDLQHIKGHYYESHRSINPHGIVPAGPDLDFASLHERALLNYG
jgi:putative glutathione S-transferase